MSLTAKKNEIGLREGAAGRRDVVCVGSFFFLFAFALQRLVLIKLVSLMKIGDWGNLV